MLGTSRRRLLSNLTLLAISTVAVAVALESAARYYVWRVFVPAQEALTPLSRFHPVLGWEKNPLAVQRIVRQEYEVTIAINSKGLRGPERDYRAPPGVRRVLILGDSFGEGYYAEEHETARAVLENLLNATGCGRVEVVNGSTLGYSTDQQYLFYRHEGYRYGAELVLVFFYPNDLLYNISAVGTAERRKPIFDLNDGQLVLRNSPLPAPPNKGSVPHPLPWRGSYFLRFVSDRTENSAAKVHAVLANLGLVQPTSGDVPRELWPYGPASGERRATIERMWSTTKALLNSIRAEAEGRGATVAALYIPGRFEVNDDVWALTRERYLMGRRWDRHAVLDRFKAIADEVGLFVVDPSERLRLAEKSAHPAYYTRDVHWTPAGNRVAADAVFDYLQRTGWVCHPNSRRPAKE